jgi:hypothetical protein
MSYLPITFREDNFPQINFRKLAANRNKKLYLLYLFLTMVKNVFARLTNNPREVRELDKAPSVGNARESAMKDRIKTSS